MIKNENHKYLIYFILSFLLIIILGKIYFNITRDNFLFIYGLLVTGGVFSVILITYAFYKDPYQETKTLSPKKPLVSCIVAVKNDEEIIERCIDSFLRQTYQEREIIIVDDASNDRTPEILKNYAEKKEIELITLSSNVGKKKALAKGILKSKGSIIAFSDSDSVLASDALEKIVTIFNNDEMIGGVCGHCRALNADRNLLTKIQDTWYEGQFSIRKAFESVFGAVTCMSGPLAVFRKESIYNFIPAWEADTFLGQEFKFATDRTLTGYLLGNKVIGDKLKKKYRASEFIKGHDYPLKEWKVVYCKSARVWTHIPDTFDRVVKQQIRWKKSFIRNMFFTGSFYWKKPLPASLMYYLHILFVLVGPFIAFRHLIYLPLSGNFISAASYLGGIIFVGFVFGLAYKHENRNCRKWIYRPLMSVLSTLVLSWLLFYSILTIKKMVWHRS